MCGSDAVPAIMQKASVTNAHGSPAAAVGTVSAFSPANDSVAAMPT